MKSLNGNNEIMIVDDNEGNVKLLVEMLTAKGYIVRPATSAALALRSIQARPPALILLDVRMPDMDGFEVCRRLKADEKTRAIPVIFITILESEQDKIKGFELGAVDYVTKPFSEAEVLARVKTHLELRRHREHLEAMVKERTAQLAESMQRVSAHIDNSPLAVIEFDPQFRITRWSKEAERVFGWTAGEVIGKSISELHWVYAEDVELVNRETDGLFNGERPRSLSVNRNYRKDGTVVHCEWYNSAIYGMRGELVSVLSQVLDVTERKRAEEALRVSEEQYRFLLDNTSDFIARYDRNSVMLFGTGASSHFHGYDLDEIIRTAGLERVHPDDRDQARSALNRVIETGTEARTEYRLKRKSGGYMWVEAAGRRVFNDTGEPEIILVQRNITERKRAEEQLGYQANLLANVTDAIIATDNHYNIEYWNTAAEAQYGWSAAEVIGRPLRDFIQNEYVQGPREAMIATVTTQGFWKGEVTQNRRDGTRFPVFATVSLVRDAAGQPVGFIALNRDITERKQTEEALHESDQNLRMIFETMSEGIALNEIVYDEHGEMVDYRILNVNKAFYSSADYRGSDVIGRLATDLYAMSTETIKDFWNQHKEKNSTAYIEFLSPVRNRWFFIATSPFVNGKFVTSFFDITARKQMEEQLRQNEAYLRGAFEHSPDMIYVLNVATRERNFLNRDTFCGYSRAELEQPNSILFAVHPDDLPALQENWKKVSAALATDSIEYRLRAKDGKWEWVHQRVAVLSVNADGTPKEIMVILSTITERKRAEIEKETAHELLRDRTNQLTRTMFDLNFILENAPFGITRIVDRRMVTVNRMMENIFQYSKEELELQTTRKLYPTEEAFEKIGREAYPALAEGVVYETEQELVRKDGTQILVRYIGRALEPSDMSKGTIWMMEDITARKQAESQREAALEKLRESEEKYRMVADFTYDWESWRTPDGSYIYVSPSCERVTGHAAAEFLADPDLHLKILHPEDAAMIRKHFEEALHIDHPDEHLEFRIINSAGEIRWVDHYCVPIHGSSGQWLGRRESNRDITERRRAEESLRASEASLREAQRLAHIGDWQWTVATDTVKWSEELYRINGRDPNLPPPSYADLPACYTPESWQRLSAAVTDAVQNGTVYELELELIRSDGVIRHTFSRGEADFDADGKVVGLHGTVQDITDRKLAEKALRESEVRFRSIINSSPVPIGMNDSDLNITLINPAFTKTYGYTVEDLPTIEDWWRKAYPDAAYRGQISRLWFERLEQAQQQGYFEPLEADIRCKDGSVRTVLSTAAIMTYGAETIVINYDITDRKQAEEEVRRLNATLEQRVEKRTQELRDAQEKLVRQEKLAVLGQMAGSVGHELRNPLAVISNAVYFLKMVQTDASDKVKEYLNLIEKNIHISDKIVGDLLDFTRIKSVDRAPVSIPDVIRQTLERFPAPENIQVEINVPADLPKAYADPQHVMQVLGNLTLNACQAMPGGGKLTVSSHQLPVLSSVEGSVNSNQSSVKTTPLITAKSPQGDHWVLITVKDTGSGISPENMQKLFEPLFTTKPKGIGLGLAVCKKLVEANGGRIEVESELGVGSIFTIYLPVNVQAQQ